MTLSDDRAHARVDVLTRLDGAIEPGTEVCHTLRDAAGQPVATHRSRATAQHATTLVIPAPLAPEFAALLTRLREQYAADPLSPASP